MTYASIYISRSISSPRPAYTPRKGEIYVYTLTFIYTYIYIHIYIYV